MLFLWFNCIFLNCISPSEYMLELRPLVSDWLYFYPVVLKNSSICVHLSRFLEVKLKSTGTVKISRMADQAMLSFLLGYIQDYFWPTLCKQTRMLLLNVMCFCEFYGFYKQFLMWHLNLVLVPHKRSRLYSIPCTSQFASCHFLLVIPLFPVYQLFLCLKKAEKYWLKPNSGC